MYIAVWRQSNEDTFCFKDLGKTPDIGTRLYLLAAVSRQIRVPVWQSESSCCVLIFGFPYRVRVLSCYLLGPGMKRLLHTDEDLKGKLLRRGTRSHLIHHYIRSVKGREDIRAMLAIPVRDLACCIRVALGIQVNRIDVIPLLPWIAVNAWLVDEYKMPG